jgi:metal-responsive CopG/Arc/MetJ family transcriptional regulator
MPKKISKPIDPDEYSNIKIPNDLIIMVDRLIGKYGYKSRGEIVKAALRDFLVKYEKA